jgi:hypothetical protein
MQLLPDVGPAVDNAVDRAERLCDVDRHQRSDPSPTQVREEMVPDETGAAGHERSRHG